MPLLPGAVLANRRAVERADVDVVEARLLEERDGAPGEGNLNRLPCPRETRAEGNAELDVPQLFAEPARLAFSTRGQRDSPVRIAVDDLCDVQRRLTVPREDEKPHRRTPCRQVRPGGPPVNTNPPARMRSRERESIQTDCPSAVSLYSGEPDGACAATVMTPPPAGS